MIKKQYYLITKARRRGFINIREAAIIKNVSCAKIEKAAHRFNHIGNLHTIKFDDKFVDWMPYHQKDSNIK